MPLDASTGFYQSATLEYRLDAGQLRQPLDVARVQGQRLWYEQVASSPLPAESTGTLSVIYPHPSGRTDVAQVKFVLESRPATESASKSWNPVLRYWPGDREASRIRTFQPELHETWALEIPQAESDGYFKVLGAQSFYDTERPGATAARLSVTINGRRIEKPWDPIPQLNLLVQRVRRDGQLVEYRRPGILAGQQPRAITSVQAYTQVAAQLSGMPVNSPQEWAQYPFSMVPAVAPALCPEAAAVAQAPGQMR
jgi:hypothetical protein